MRDILILKFSKFKDKENLVSRRSTAFSIEVKVHKQLTKRLQIRRGQDDVFKMLEVFSLLRFIYFNVYSMRVLFTYMYVQHLYM